MQSNHDTIPMRTQLRSARCLDHRAEPKPELLRRNVRCYHREDNHG